MIRPYVFINVAASADGKTDTFERRGAAISSAADRARVDGLRAAADAVMVGGRTLLAEDPKLTVKSASLQAGRAAKGLPENPMKVGIVSRADLKLDGDFVRAGPARRVIFTTAQTTARQAQALSALGVEVYVMGEKRVDLPKALETLKSLGVERLMVEGGGTLNFELLRLGLVDELTIYVAPLIFGGDSAPTMAAGDGLARSAAIPLKLADVRVADETGGVLIRYLLSK
jgi:2,5-diamino-6-(ribosylamino)-4(3H)-pyrimidinone 5'-phosphate reductase